MITLKKGSKGWQVKQLQKMLEITADGVFGKGTEQAVIYFQIIHGLTVDGKVGFNTWLKLNSVATSKVVQKVEMAVRPKPKNTAQAFKDKKADLLLPLWGYSARSRVKNAFDKVMPYIEPKLEQMHLNTPELWIGFAGQIREEVGNNFTLLENLNYRCSALTKLFSYYRKNPQEARLQGRCDGHSADQKMIANNAYANRIGNGNASSGDGSRYMGAGVKMLTGKANYQKYSDWLKDKFPDVYNATNGDLIMKKGAEVVKESPHCILSAIYFWVDNKVYEGVEKHGLTKLGSDYATAIVNKHTNSYGKRWNHMQKSMQLMGIA